MTRAPARAAVLGLDLGTSRVKALLCAAAGGLGKSSTADGAVLGRGVASYRVAAPRDGWAETDPEQWWQAARGAVRAALGPAPAEVAGLAVVGQMHGLVLYAGRAVVLRPAIVWLDGRAFAEVGDYLRLPAGLRAHQPVPFRRPRDLPPGRGAERRGGTRLGAADAGRELGRAVRHGCHQRGEYHCIVLCHDRGG
ncbi:MAG: FGGY family carbohydrate kinase [Streptosporangiaceae bacterium]